MEYANTSICLVTAHLAAGFANYEERNQDYRTISHGLRFQRNRTIEDHETIIWLGDFNYRIGMSNDRTRSLIKAGDLETLYANDQLNLQMVHGKTFPFYNEARITFLPTYKYDLGTDDYDSSDKARIPAWCDRVLSKGTNIRQINYEAAPLRFSDHRPVWANFQCTVTMVDEKRKTEISEQLYRRRRVAVGDSASQVYDEDSDDEDDDALGYESIDPVLPPASSDRRKWWLDNGQPARSTVKGPPAGADWTRNPARPVNPFSQTTEPDWVKVDRPFPRPSRTTLPVREGVAVAENGAASSNAPPARTVVPLPLPPRSSPASQTLRKLPPPWQGSGASTPASRASSTASTEQTISHAADARSTRMSSERRPSSTTSTSTLTKQMTRKAVPPAVAKKPAFLRSESGTSVATRTSSSTTSRQDMGSAAEARGGTLASGVAGVKNVPFPPPPRRAMTGQQGNRLVKSRGENEEEEKAPPLPARVGSSVVVDGEGVRRESLMGGSLMDEESEGAMRGWAALKPN